MNRLLPRGNSFTKRRDSYKEEILLHRGDSSTKRRTLLELWLLSLVRKQLMWLVSLALPLVRFWLSSPLSSPLLLSVPLSAGSSHSSVPQPFLFFLGVDSSVSGCWHSFNRELRRRTRPVLASPVRRQAPFAQLLLWPEKRMCSRSTSIPSKLSPRRVWIRSWSLRFCMLHHNHLCLPVLLLDSGKSSRPKFYDSG